MQAVKPKTRLIVFCNKSEMVTASSMEAIRSSLESEMFQISTSFSYSYRNQAVKLKAFSIGEHGISQDAAEELSDFHFSESNITFLSGSVNNVDSLQTSLLQI